MTISSSGISLIKSFEAFKSKPYLPTPDDVPTIGYGTTIYPNGVHVKLSDPAITEDQATAYLTYSTKAVESCINRLVHVHITQNQYDALCSFVYNIGETNFKASTLLKLLNDGHYNEAADQFPRWNKQAGKVLNGLTVRRAKERALFLK